MTPYFHLTRLALLLFVPNKATLSTYGRGGRVCHLRRLPGLKELRITMEGLFGSTDNLGDVFDGCSFTPTKHHGPLASVEDLTFEEILHRLPPSLETLEIDEWWHEYTQPQKLLPILSGLADDDFAAAAAAAQMDYQDDEDCTKRLKALNQATIAALAKMATALQRTTSVKKVLFRPYKWDAKESDSLFLACLAAPIKECGIRDTAGQDGDSSKGESMPAGTYLEKLYLGVGITFQIVRSEFNVERNDERRIADIEYTGDW
ncbi:hypothetical protein QBC34DRAFT_435594 [Podospora aff. communis PSN243]|uniref:Uncharacterized protein n=1 Tax=Podospora aff. communis PSN243 TaxID=3040156 RepID=A0AAV9H1L7_9PEZI|nr:hypothetical protein QBC34DRAFT_435594 [Podospora aff. communis PSN243]